MRRAVVTLLTAVLVSRGDGKRGKGTKRPVSIIGNRSIEEDAAVDRLFDCHPYDVRLVRGVVGLIEPSDVASCKFACGEHRSPGAKSRSRCVAAVHHRLRCALLKVVTEERETAHNRANATRAKAVRCVKHSPFWVVDREEDAWRSPASFSLIAASETVVRFAGGKSFRYFSVVDRGPEEPVLVFARDGTFPNAVPHSRIMTWTAADESLAEVEWMRPRFIGLHSANLLPIQDAAHNYAVALVGGKAHFFGGRSRQITRETNQRNHSVNLRRPTTHPENATNERTEAEATGIVHFAGCDLERTLPSAQWSITGTTNIRHYLKPICSYDITDTRIIAGTHQGCVEDRPGFEGRCEFDGKLTVAPLNGRVYLYTRANTALGSRAVQVAHAARPDGTYTPFELVRIRGWDLRTTRHASTYFISVEPHPIEPRALVGFFPVNYNDGGATECLIYLAVSFDGVAFGDLEPLVDARCAPDGRVRDLPVAGLVRREPDKVFFYVHRDMPSDDGIASVTFRPHLVRHELNITALDRITERARRRLGGPARLTDAEAAARAAAAVPNPLWGRSRHSIPTFVIPRIPGTPRPPTYNDGPNPDHFDLW